MVTVTAYEAKTHLPSLLKRVAAGERITITRHGVPVAVLSPPADRPKLKVDDAIDALLEFRKGQKLSKEIVRQMIDEGRP